MSRGCRSHSIFSSIRRRTEQQLLDYLREKSMLLVLDNFEHLLDGGELVSRYSLTRRYESDDYLT